MKKIYLFVAILENGRHLGFSIDQSDGMDLKTIEMSHANFGACIIMCMSHPMNANYLLHCKAVFTQRSLSDLTLDRYKVRSDKVCVNTLNRIGKPDS